MLWHIMFVVLVVGAGVWLVATLAGFADLGLLPRHKRERVEWCRHHVLQVGGACGVVLAGLMVAQLTSTL